MTGGAWCGTDGRMTRLNLLLVMGLWSGGGIGARRPVGCTCRRRMMMTYAEQPRNSKRHKGDGD